MGLDVNLVRARFGIRILGRRQGPAAEGDRELLGLQLEVANHGDREHHFRWDRFTLEDSERYLIDAAAADDALDAVLPPGSCARGKLLFAIYPDLEPVTLWFDTGETYAASSAPLLIDIPLGADAAPHRPPTWKEQAVATHDRELSAEELGGGKLLPLFETRELMDTISRRLGRPYRRLSNGYLFDLPLPGGRRQNVMMSFRGADEQGADLIRFLTLCAPADDEGANHDLFLRMNPGLPHGAIGITRIGEQRFYVVTETQLAATADPEELVGAITHLARIGDELEDRLTGGADLR